jgi:hypothetical protein
MGLLVFAIWNFRKYKKYKLLTLTLVSVLFSIIYSTVFLGDNMAEKFPQLTTKQISSLPIIEVTKEIIIEHPKHTVDSSLPTNLISRQSMWQYYYTGITQNTKSILFGQNQRPDRKLYPSAHNYYLDFIYNFGLISILPTLWLLAYTIMAVTHRVMRYRKIESNETISLVTLSGIVFFLLLVDNSFKVSLRQPYPGIFTFFLWGLLLSKLAVVSKNRKHVF